MPAYSQEDSAALERRARTILVIAHPGHELRVHGWLETTPSEVWVLTDGSGRTGRSRLDSTTRVVEATGGVPGTVYGEMTDVDLYRAVLNFEHSRFTVIVDQLAGTLMRNNVECVTGDAQEGYNPAHDICRLLINAAARLVKRKTDREILNYDFTLVGTPAHCPDELRARALWLNLDEAAFARKISAACNYPELQAEVEAALNGSHNHTLPKDPDLSERLRSNYGVTQASNFRIECLRPVNSHGATAFDYQKPFYEEYGERQVRAGHYTDVLRYREHMLPLAAALDAYVERGS
jgi:hypothetical protein